MKMFVRSTGVLLLLILSANVIGSEAYRIAGIIAHGEADWRAIVELPDGEQRVVTEGDHLGQVEVVRISKQGVILQFPGGERQMQLSQGDYITQPHNAVLRARVQNEGSTTGRVGADQNSKQAAPPQLPAGEKPMQLSKGAQPVDTALSTGAQSEAGVAVEEFSKMVDKKLDPGLLAGVTGLETLDMLSESARIVAYSYPGDPQQVRTPINSLESGVNVLHQAIVEEKGLRITVEGDESIPDFYVMPLPVEQN